MGNKLRLAAMLISVGLFMPLFVVRQWGNPITTDQAKEFTITLPLAARVYAIMLTDTSSTLYQALDVTMCWDRDNLDRVISAFRVKATFPPSTFNWLFIGRIN